MELAGCLALEERRIACPHGEGVFATGTSVKGVCQRACSGFWFLLNGEVWKPKMCVELCAHCSTGEAMVFREKRRNALGAVSSCAKQGWGPDAFLFVWGDGHLARCFSVSTAALHSVLQQVVLFSVVRGGMGRSQVENPTSMKLPRPSHVRNQRIGLFF